MSDPRDRTDIVTARGITKLFVMGGERIHALRDVSFGIPRSSIVGISGPSGSGKSTLLNIVGLFEHPDQGSLLLDGEEIVGLDDKRLETMRRDKFGFVFQSYNLIPVLTALENVELVLFTSAMTSVERRSRAREALTLVGLEDRISHYPRELSGGQQQRVAIARALVKSPAIIIADEPTANLDGATAEQVLKTVELANRERGVSFLIATHDQRVLDHMPRVLRLMDGALH